MEVYINFMIFHEGWVMEDINGLEKIDLIIAIEFFNPCITHMLLK